MSARRALDAELVRRGLAADRSEAQDLIAGGKVVVGGAPALNPARQTHAGEPINLAGPPPKYVGRGGFKLEAALDGFAIDVDGRRAVDVGASTGGFTDCLLQRGAPSVLSLDVGHGQIHERLRADDRVTVLERTDVRSVSLSDLGLTPFDVVVTDVSFISLSAVAGALLALASPHADVIALIKPQFEAGRDQVSKGRGVIRDRQVWEQAVLRVLDAMAELGAATMGLMISPVLGAEGNVEFLGWFKPGPISGSAFDFGASASMFDAAELLSQGVG